MILFS